MKKRWIAFLIVFFMMFTPLTIVQAKEQSSVQIEAEQVIGDLEEEVTIDISLTNNTETGFVSGIWEYYFNPVYLQCTQVEGQTILDQAYTNVHIDNENGVVRIVGIEATPNTQSGNIAVLHFTIQKDNVKTIPITVKVVELKDKEGNDIIAEITKQGSITIQNPSEDKPLKGDINQDGKVALYDAFKILEQAILGGNLDETSLYIMDYNEDGKVTLYDAFKFLEIAILG